MRSAWDCTDVTLTFLLSPDSRYILLPVVLHHLHMHLQEQKDLIMCARILSNVFCLIKKNSSVSKYRSEYVVPIKWLLEIKMLKVLREISLSVTLWDSHFYFQLGWTFCFSSEKNFFSSCKIAITPNNLGFLNLYFEKELNTQWEKLEISKPPTCIFNLDMMNSLWQE